MSAGLFVLVHNGGCEGCSPPVQAFVQKDTALAALALLKNGDSLWELYEVPVWPAPATLWYDTDPMAAEVAT